MSRLKIFFILIIIYPSLYIFDIIFRKMDTSFANVYFLFIFILMFLMFRLKVTRNNLMNIVLILSLIVIILFNFTSFRYLKPLFFFFFFFFLFFSLNTSQLKSINLINLYSYKYTLYLILFSSVVMIILDYGYTDLGRFKGFLISPTVFSVFLDVLFIFFLIFNRNKYLFFILYTLFVYLHFESETRLNLAFLLLLPIVYIYIKNKTKKVKNTLIILYLIVLNFIYPIYQYYSISNPNNMLVSRYEDKRDASFGLRLSLYNIGINVIRSSTTNELLFGHGSEHTRKLIIDEYGKDLLIHNDFIRFTIDFGILALFIYLFLIIRLSLANNLSYLLVMLYFLVFYHNMIYSYYLISLIIMSQFININKYKDKND